MLLVKNQCSPKCKVHDNQFSLNKIFPDFRSTPCPYTDSSQIHQLTFSGPPEKLVWYQVCITHSRMLPEWINHQSINSRWICRHWRQTTTVVTGHWLAGILSGQLSFSLTRTHTHCMDHTFLDKIFTITQYKVIHKIRETKLLSIPSPNIVRF